jgi:hypothetical protein
MTQAVWLACLCSLCERARSCGHAFQLQREILMKFGVQMGLCVAHVRVQQLECRCRGLSANDNVPG